MESRTRNLIIGIAAIVVIVGAVGALTVMGGLDGTDAQTPGSGTDTPTATPTESGASAETPTQTESNSDEPHELWDESDITNEELVSLYEEKGTSPSYQAVSSSEVQVESGTYSVTTTTDKFDEKMVRIKDEGGGVSSHYVELGETTKLGKYKAGSHTRYAKYTLPRAAEQRFHATFLQKGSPFKMIFSAGQFEYQGTTTVDGVKVTEYSLTGLAETGYLSEEGELPDGQTERSIVADHYRMAEGNLDLNGYLYITKNGDIRELAFSINGDDPTKAENQVGTFAIDTDVVPKPPDWIETAREDGLHLSLEELNDEYAALKVENGNLESGQQLDFFSRDTGVKRIEEEYTLTEGETIYLTLKDDQIVLTKDQPTGGTMTADLFSLILRTERGVTAYRGTFR